MISFKRSCLVESAKDILQVYGISVIIAFIILACFPCWLRWLFFYICGIGFLVYITAPFVEDLIPRSRVQATGKAVFITGCDSGFGKMLARQLDNLGLQVYAGCFFPEGEGAFELKESTSSKLHIVPIDVTSDESIKHAVEYVTEKLEDNKLWAVVNNSGINDGGELFWTNNDIIQRIMDVNTFGVVKITRAFLPLLVKYKGRVVTVASAAARFTISRLVPYCMSKQAALSFCDGLRQEMYKFGIKVVTVEPYIYKTDINDEPRSSQNKIRTWDAAPQEIRELYPDDYLKQYLDSTQVIKSNLVSDKRQEVIDCLVEAILARSPKYSYNPGTTHARLCFWILRHLPKRLADSIVIDRFSN